MGDKATYPARLKRADSFKPWFFKVVRNRHLNRVRRLKLARRFQFHAVPENSVDLSERTVERSKLTDALDTLAAEEREALILFEVEGFQLRDIAKIQRRSVATIKYRLRQGRNKLRLAYFSDTPRPSAGAIPVKDE